MFLCMNTGAPEAEPLKQFSLMEGTPNTYGSGHGL